MRPTTLALILGMAAAASLRADSPCPQRTPAYVLEGGAGMIGVEAAEALTCLEDDAFSQPFAEADVIQDHILTNEEVRQILAKRTNVIFRHCRTKEAIDIGGRIGAVAFESCDFEGSVRLNGVRARSIDIRDSLFHQNFEITDTVITRTLTIYGSVFTTKVEIDTTQIMSGLLMQNARVRGPFELSAVSAERCLTFERVRFLDNFAIASPEIRDCITFRGCEWNQDKYVSFAKGFVGTIRFDACDFDGKWVDASGEQAPTQIRFSGMTIHSALLLSSVASTRYPTLRVDRSIISHIRLPDWEIAESMVVKNPTEQTTADRESLLETLGVVRASYEREGRQRDASRASDEYRLILSRIRGPVAYTMNLVRKWTDDYILMAFVGLVLLVACIYWWLEERWDPKRSRLGAVGASLDASWSGVFSGPDKDAQYRSTKTPVILRVSRIVGAVVLFYVVARLQVLFNG